MKPDRAIIIWIVAVACVIGAAACQTVGPNYRGAPRSAAVDSAAAQSPFVSASGSAFSRGRVPGAWWRLYDAPRLDELVREALATNTDLRAARANLERSAALLQQARARRQPSVAVNFDPSYQQLSPESYLHSGSVAPTGLYDAGISVGYEVDLFGRLRRAVEAAAADAEASEAAYDLTKIVVAAETARAYADVCGAGEQLAAARHSLQLQVRATTVMRRLVDAGRAPVTDLTRSAALVEQIQANIPTLEAERSNALFRLAALTGRAPVQYPRSVGTCSRAPRLPQPIPVGDGAALLRRRPDVREAERQLAAATARIGVATADLYPTITLGFQGGSTGAITDFLTSPTNRYRIGVGIHWQANHSLARAEIAAASAGARLALAHFDGVVLIALRDTETAITSYSRDRQRDEDLAAAEARDGEAEQDAQRLYASGKTDFLSLLDAERTQAAAEAALATSHAQLASDQINLFLELGGGWQ